MLTMSGYEVQTQHTVPIAADRVRMSGGGKWWSLAGSNR